MAGNYSFPTDEYVLLGKVTKAHGIKGELKMVSFSGELQSITRHNKLLLVSTKGQISPSYDVVRSRAGNKEAIVQLKGVTDRNSAEELCGLGVLVSKDDLPKLQGDEFYLHELEGLQVKTEAGEMLGKVDAFFHNGMQDILVIRQGNEEILIPLIPGMITERDENSLTIAPPPGLLTLNSGERKQGHTAHDI
jgi:16S rRNA processing protein RimM